MKKQKIITLDLEGVLIPEVWIAVAEKTGIEGLKLTTRDIPDYNELMQGRIKIVNDNNLGIKEIQDVISTLSPMDGAKEFLDELRSLTQVIILSDTFEEFAHPFMKQLAWPTIFCHSLVIEGNTIVNYKLRQEDQKRKAVNNLKDLNYSIAAAGDSYNDTTMLGVADSGALFKAPQNVIEEFSQYPSFTEYGELLSHFKEFLKD